MVCPKKCIQMKPDKEGFLHPVVDSESCIDCGLCSKTCPVLNLPAVPKTGTKAYAAIFSDESARMKSTSGGVFTALARWVFARNGIVFGAAYADDFSVYHCAVSNEEELQKLRTAKYAQSRLGVTFCQAEAYLQEGRIVLFSGTPCQIAGLQAYLKKPYKNLILVDVICHGVPSPKVWQHYIGYRKQQDAPESEIKAINLRSKETGWPVYSIRFEYEDGTVYSAKNNADPFLRGFVGDYYLRSSCCECEFKGISRSSDFTLADYWGVWSQLPEYNDGKGTSLVLIHSECAQKIWNDIRDQLKCQELDPVKAIEENPSAIKPSHMPENREAFWNRYPDEDFKDLITELLPPPPPPARPSLLKRVARKIKKTIIK